MFVSLSAEAKYRYLRIELREMLKKSQSISDKIRLLEETTQTEHALNRFETHAECCLESFLTKIVRQLDETIAIAMVVDGRTDQVPYEETEEDEL